MARPVSHEVNVILKRSSVAIAELLLCTSIGELAPFSVSYDLSRVLDAALRGIEGIEAERDAVEEPALASTGEE